MKFYMGKPVLKIGTVELLEEDAKRLYESGEKYLVTYSTIYEIKYSANLDYHYYGHAVYKHSTKGQGGMTHRGRFFAYTAAQVNNLLGYNLLNVD